MMLWWMLSHSGPNTVDVVKFEAGYSSKSANRAAKSPPLKNKKPQLQKNLEFWQEDLEKESTQQAWLDSRSKKIHTKGHDTGIR